MRNSTFWAKLLSSLQNRLEDHSKDPAVALSCKRNFFFFAFEYFAYITRVLPRFYTWVDNFNNPYLYCCRGEHLANLSHECSLINLVASNILLKKRGQSLCSSIREAAHFEYKCLSDWNSNLINRYILKIVGNMGILFVLHTLLYYLDFF